MIRYAKVILLVYFLGVYSKMVKFNKRFYKSFSEFRNDLKELNKIKKIVKDYGDREKINADFRERIMLAVTRVNECRYCSYLHSNLALKSGINKEEINLLLQGEYKNCSDEEIPAVLYAQHWADNNGNPDIEAKNKLIEVYGEKKAINIEMYLRMIRIGNLTGNTIDFFLYKLSYGKFGIKK